MDTLDDCDGPLALPQQTLGDYLHMLTSGTIGTIPLVGNAAVEAFKFVFNPQLEKRKMEWCAAVVEKLRELETRKSVTLEQLRADEGFTSVVVLATQTAFQTHDADRLMMLRNAVANAALGAVPDDVKRHLFLRFVSEFTSAHVVVLQFLQDTARGAAKRGKVAQSVMSAGQLRNITEGILTELDDQGDLLQVIHADLQDRALIGDRTRSEHLVPNGHAHKFTSGLGDEFLAFIAEPTSN